MNIKGKEIKITADKIVDASVVVCNVGIDFCVKKVVKEIIKNSLPEPTKISQKIIFKVGEYAFTAAIGAVVADKMNSIGNTIKEGITEIKKIKENIKEIKEEGNGSSESKAEQQQVQEGE